MGSKTFSILLANPLLQMAIGEEQPFDYRSSHHFRSQSQGNETSYYLQLELITKFSNTYFKQTLERHLNYYY
ncbi:hypothetical protein F5B17DRAFT_423533 [Nemania serpens]|nr:hypothetical protein F5B17DRAFT_423533 [Nemania serpens]